MKLYRFEKPEDFRWETIRENKIWMSLPSGFNDLFDCKLPCEYSPNALFDVNKIKDVANTLYSNHQKLSYFINPDFIRDVILWSGGNDYNMPPFVKSFIHDIERLGIQCFTELNYKNPIMWAHYADRNTGFCVEYQVVPNHPEFEFEGEGIGFRPANYTSQMIKFDYREILFCPDIAAIRYVTRKSSDWAYEKEWRLIYANKDEDMPGAGYRVDLPKFIEVSGIYAGPMCKDLKVLSELKACADHLQVPFRKIHVDPFTYELEIYDEDFFGSF
ncbi:MAG: hypothetical protein COW58_02350 [Thalassolituus sp. CG17_big_fil_post_rev_8_21_14_2_50_53_8]|nr:MAG: hypothetical protein COW58_02350 [Thalassolituus sp. CG17_big_fil_post_rev_8_21_14_2_50_53_8]